MKKLKILSMFLIFTLALSACGGSQEEANSATNADATNSSETDDKNTDSGDEKAEESEGTSQGNAEDNVTGGKQVEQVSKDVLVITNTDGNSVISAVNDESTDTLEGTGLEVESQIYDTDGNGLVDADKENGEKITMVINITNNSGKTYKIDKLDYYFTGINYMEKVDGEYEYIDIPIEKVESEEVSKEDFEVSSGNTVKYKNDDTYDSFDLKDGESVKIVTTGQADLAIDGVFSSHKITFMATAPDEDTLGVTVEFDFKASDE